MVLLPFLISDIALIETSVIHLFGYAINDKISGQQERFLNFYKQFEIDLLGNSSRK